MVASKKSMDFQDTSNKIQAGLEKAYQKLVEKKAKEGGVLILSVDGKPTRVPAVDLLKKLKKSA